MNSFMACYARENGGECFKNIHVFVLILAGIAGRKAYLVPVLLE
jgi:hypothetical protein